MSIHTCWQRDIVPRERKGTLTHKVRQEAYEVLVLVLNLKDVDQKLDLLLLAPRFIKLVGHGDRHKAEHNSALSVDGIRL